VAEVARAPEQLAQDLIDLYPVALPKVYGYLATRCGHAMLAEDLTADTFMAAVSAIERGTVQSMTTGWLIVVARRRLVDHWRRRELEERKLQLLQGEEADGGEFEDNADLNQLLRALSQLPPEHRAALTLRYLDGLPVAEVAEQLGRGLHSTEGLLQRSRRALRRIYDAGDWDA
jgi:RNA polymerase sigma-70 factor (ECF subfamily)